MNEITPRGEEPAPRIGYVPRRRVSWGARSLLSSATSGGVVVVTPGNGSSLAGGANPPSANTPAPTGRGGEQSYQYSPGGSGGGDGNSARSQPFWGTALFSFIALVLGLGVAAWSGGTGADAAERSLSGTTA